MKTIIQSLLLGTCISLSSISLALTATDAAAAERTVADRPLSIRHTLSEKTAHVEAGKLMILGSPHLLQELDSDFDPEWLDNVRKVLKDFGPEVVAIEVFRPEDIRTKRHLDDRRDDWNLILDMFASRAIEAAEIVREELGLDWGNARRQQLALLEKAQAGKLATKKRQQLVINSLAAYDFHTALVQWAHLEPEARESIEGLNEKVSERLDHALTSRNESIQLGVQLAVELGLQRVHPIDDQLSLGIQSLEEHRQMGEILSELGVQKKVKSLYEEDRATPMAEFRKKNDLLPLYRHLNSTTYAQFDIETQWAAFFDERMDEEMGRTRMARREVRDLSIAANVRQASARYPGKNVLVVIGASHRPFLESYLSDMSDLEIVRFTDLVSAD